MLILYRVLENLAEMNNKQKPTLLHIHLVHSVAAYIIYTNRLAFIVIILLH